MVLAMKEENLSIRKYFEKVRSNYSCCFLAKQKRASTSLHKAIVAPLPANGFCLARGAARDPCPLRGIGLSG